MKMFVNWKMLETQNAASWTKLSVIPDAEGRQIHGKHSELFTYAAFLKVTKIVLCRNVSQKM